MITNTLDDIYVPRNQDRTSIRVAVDGVEMMIGKENCNATVLELFEKIVFDRQAEKIVRYLTFKYPNGFLTHEQAKHELQVTEYKYKDLYEFSEIAEVIADDVVN